MGKIEQLHILKVPHFCLTLFFFWRKWNVIIPVKLDEIIWMHNKYFSINDFVVCNYNIVLIFSLLGQAESGGHDTGCEHWILPWHYLRWGRYTKSTLRPPRKSVNTGGWGFLNIKLASHLGFWWILWEILCPSLSCHSTMAKGPYFNYVSTFLSTIFDQLSTLVSMFNK